MTRPLHVIAWEIERKWPKVHYAARPYLDAMFHLNTLTDRYYYDDAEGIVRRFLTNAGTWRGDDARRIKAELKEMLHGR